jgi:hypothetical protein
MTIGLSAGGGVIATQGVLSKAATATRLGMNLAGTPGGFPHIALGLYDDSGNFIVSASGQPNALGYFELPISPTSLSAGNYWVAFVITDQVSAVISLGGATAECAEAGGSGLPPHWTGLQGNTCNPAAPQLYFVAHF